MLKQMVMKSAARKEIDLIRKGFLSEQGISKVVANNAGQNERYLSHIGSGYNQNADLVLHPVHGVAVRKTLKNNYDMDVVRSNPDLHIQQHLMDYQNNAGHSGGFAKTHEVDSRYGMTFHEPIKGLQVSKMNENAKSTIHAKGYGPNNVPANDLMSSMLTGLNNQSPIKNMFATHIPEDMQNTVTHLQGKFPNLWDHNKLDNLMLTNKGGQKRMVSVDLQGSDGAHLDNHNPVGEDKGYYFKNRQKMQGIAKLPNMQLTHAG